MHSIIEFIFTGHRTTDTKHHPKQIDEEGDGSTITYITYSHHDMMSNTATEMSYVRRSEQCSGPVLFAEQCCGTSAQREHVQMSNIAHDNVAECSGSAMFLDIGRLSCPFVYSLLLRYRNALIPHPPVALRKAFVCTFCGNAISRREFQIKRLSC